jgi:hypothetical protein
MKTFKLGDVFEITEPKFGEAYVRWEFHDAPTGGRTVFQGPIHPKPFAFFFALCSIIDGRSPAERGDKIPVPLAVGERFIIEGYGEHEVTRKDVYALGHLGLLRIEDGFTS